MHTHTFEVLGFELSFKTEADPERVEKARVLLNERYAKLIRHGGHVSKEKLLAFLALSLADDILLLRDEKSDSMKRVKELLGNIEKVAG